MEHVNFGFCIFHRLKSTSVATWDTHGRRRSHRAPTHLLRASHHRIVIVIRAFLIKVEDSLLLERLMIRSLEAMMAASMVTALPVAASTILRREVRRVAETVTTTVVAATIPSRTLRVPIHSVLSHLDSLVVLFSQYACLLAGSSAKELCFVCVTRTANNKSPR